MLIDIRQADMGLRGTFPAPGSTNPGPMLLDHRIKARRLRRNASAQALGKPLLDGFELLHRRGDGVLARSRHHLPAALNLRFHLGAIALDEPILVFGLLLGRHHAEYKSASFMARSPLSLAIVRSIVLTILA